MSHFCNKIFVNVCRTALLAPCSVISRSLSSGLPKNGGRNVFKLGLVGVTVGALVGTGYSIHQLNKPQTHISNEEISIPVVPEVPKVIPSKRVSFRIAYVFYLCLTKLLLTDHKCERSEWFKTHTLPVPDLPVLLQSSSVPRLLWDFLRCCRS